MLVNTITMKLSIGTPQLLLPANPRRKSFLVCPLPVGAGGLISIGPAGTGQNAVVAGGGVLNFVVGMAFPTTISDEDFGSAVGVEWYIISSKGGETVQVVEVSYGAEDY